MGFFPDSISTDIHKRSINGGLKDMAHAMTAVLNLGAALEDVIRMSTSEPAKIIKHPELGNLDVGAEADVALLRVDEGSFRRLDSAQASYPGDRRISADMTIRAGKIVYDAGGRSATDWQQFPYRRD